MTAATAPSHRPANPHFSSGPCAKRPGYRVDTLDLSALGRSHRAAPGKGHLEEVCRRTADLLELPSGYRVGVVPGSDTGAFEMAMWSLLGERPVEVLAWESFGKGWVTDAVKQLKLPAPNVREADYGHLPSLEGIDPASDVVFTWNGTTAGVRVPNGDWISDSREGLTLCDATSAVFAMDIPWPKIDVATFSWQKALGGEGGHGVIILSPRAVERLESYTPSWPIPKVFRLTKGGKAAIAERDWLNYLAVAPETRSTTSVCLTVDAEPAEVKEMISLLASEKAALDIGAYRDAPAGLRIWCGPTVETENLSALVPWLDWAYQSVTR